MRLPAHPSVALVLALLLACPAFAQDPPPEPGVRTGGNRTGRKDPRDGVRMGDPAPAPDKPAPEAPETDKPAGKSEPELLVEQLSTWPAVEAKRAAVRLGAQPTVAFPLLRDKITSPKQTWNSIAGVAAAFGHMRDPRALELLDAKLQDRVMFTHPNEILDAILEIDPVGGRTRMLAALLHPASAVVLAARQRLVERVSVVDVPTLRDIYTSGGRTSRAAAIDLIARADPEAARADLVRALRDDSPEVCVAAAEALGRDDGDDALELLRKAALAPVDRQLAYAYLAIGFRAARTGRQLLRPGDVKILAGSRGLKNGNPLNRAVAGIVLADAGYVHELDELAGIYDERLVPVLLDAWVGTEYWEDMTVVQPLALRRLQRLTGESSIAGPREWVSWWEQHREDFKARRVLSKVLPEHVNSLLLTVKGSAAPGQETTIMAADADLLPPPLGGELVLLLPEKEAARLAEAINASGLFAGRDEYLGEISTNGPLSVSIEAGGRQFRASLRPEFLSEGVAALMSEVAALRKSLSWQRYRPIGSAVDLTTFVGTSAPLFDEDQSPADRRAALSRLIARSIDGASVERDLAALRDLTSDPEMPKLLGAADVDRLLAMLGREETVTERGEAIVRALALAGRPESVPLLLDFLATRPSPRTSELVTLVLSGAGDDELLHALKSEDSRIRIAALGALKPESGGGRGIALARTALTDNTPTVRAEAVRALGRLRAEDARDELEDLAAKPGELRIAAVEALGLLGGKQSLSAIMSAYASEEPAVRLAAVRAFASSREPEGLSAVVFAMTNDTSSLVREVAHRSIREIGTEQAAQALRKLVVDAGQQAIPRSMALQSYAQLRGTDATIDLRRLLFDPAERVADEAAFALAGWRDPEAVPRLVRMLEEGREVQRTRRALESISLEAFDQDDPKVLASLYAGWYEVAKEVGPRGWLADGLMRRGVTSDLLPKFARGETGREMVPLLLDALDSEEWFMRRAADLALRELLNRKVGDQDWWTPPGEQARMKREWNNIWGEILGR